MLRSVFGKSLRDRRTSLFWWAVGILAYMLILAVSYPTVADQREELERLVESYPEAVLAMLGVAPGQDLFSPAGYIASQATALIVPLAFAILAAAIGAKAIAGEEEENTIDLLLANPISRTRVVVEKFVAMVAALTWLGAVLFVSIWLGRFFEMGIAASHLVGQSVAAVLLATVFGAIALAAGGVTGRRGITQAVTAFLAVGAFLLDALGQIIPALEDARRLSPFYYYNASQPLVNGYDGLHGLVLVAISAVALALAVWGFNRRDVAV